jgi:hypothetical protein
MDAIAEFDRGCGPRFQAASAVLPHPRPQRLPLGVLRNLKAMLGHGRLAGTGYLSILPVDQGVEHSAGASAPNYELPTTTDY